MITAVEVTFWVVAPIAVGLGLGVVLMRHMVHSALCLAGLMVCVGVLYAVLDAPFLFVAQLIVYLGSVLMVFVFAMMLIGIDTLENLKETIKGHRIASVVAALGVAALLVAAVAQAFVGQPAGLEAVNRAGGGNAESLAVILFTRYVVAFEATAALVITAALGAMVLAHRERLAPRRTQRLQAAARMQAYATEGAHPGAAPGSGVYARHNSIDYPALLPDGSPAKASVSATLVARGQSVLDPRHLARPVIEAHNELVEAEGELTGEPAATLEQLPAPDRSEPAMLGSTLSAAQREDGTK